MPRLWDREVAMRVFVTGATGFVGTAVVRELTTAGHQVLGLARSDAGAEALKQAGVEVHRGELTDTASLVAGALACEGVIHTAFIHDFSKFMENVEIDRVAVAAMAGALEGSGKPFVVTSGAAMVARDRVSTEYDVPAPGVPRGASEAIVEAASGRGLRSSVVRLAPSVHGAGDHGFVPQLIAIARAKGFAAYVGDGANRWPAVHRLDAARLYRLALEKAPPGARLHGVAEEGVPMRAIAETIGAGLGLPVRGLDEAAAAEHFGWFLRFVALDFPTSSALTRASLGWRPEGPDLLRDMRESGYFA
jgi:nucleoside-diphosphate-sugar epimerase